jgi:hypothetical protein
MKQTTTLSTLALILAAGSFTLAGGCGKTEQSASIEPAGSEVTTLESQQPTTEQAAASAETAETAGEAPATVASETE